jgi:uncharacterized protein YecT (DUF1311 family)
MKDILLVTLLAVLAPQFAAADELYDKCMADSNDTNASWSVCGSEWLKRADEKLNEVWDSLYSGVSGQTKKDLLAEQRAWIPYKEKSCLFLGNGDWGREGQVLHFPICRAGVIESRIKELESYKNDTDGEP